MRTNLIRHRIPRLTVWNYNEDDDEYRWQEPDAEGGRLFIIYKPGNNHYACDVVHTDGSVAGLNRYFARPKDVLFSLRKDKYFA